MYKTLTLPLLLTLFLHGAILAVILIDMPNSKPMVKRAATRYIPAELVTMEKPKAKKPAPVHSPAKPKPQPTPPPKPKPKQDDSKAKQQALEQQKAAQAKQALIQQQKQQQIKKQQQEQQQKQKLEQQRQENQRRLREQSERELADAIAQENAQYQAQSDAELANSYIALITEVIQNNWSRPPSARNSMETELALQLVPTGEVVSVKVVKSSGNAAFDRAAETAVLRAGRFPELQKLPPKVFEQYFRRLILKFKPEDLRL